MNEIEFDGEEIQKALPNYKFVRTLGKGSYGKVFLVSSKADHQLLAVKKINCFGMCQYERANAANQVRILASLDHPNIITFNQAFFDTAEDDIYIFMEYASEGDLSNLIEQARDKKKRISETLIWKVLHQMAEGLEYLHQNSIIHRDIKPANIFKSAEGQFKLADMNVSKIIGKGELATTKAGSPLYVSPQVWSNKQQGYNEKCDVWSLGVVIYELCCLKVPYEASSIEELIRMQKSIKLKNIPTEYSQKLNQLIHEMLQVHPKGRISATKLKQACQKNLKLQIDQKTVNTDPLIDTIVLPESEQRWINLVPLPPKSTKRESLEKKNASKEKCSLEETTFRSNIFTSLENRSNLFIPKSNKHNLNQEKVPRLRLPSIKKQISTQQNNRSRSHSRQASREKSGEIKSRERQDHGVSRERSRILSRERSGTRRKTPTGGEVKTNQWIVNC